MLRKIIQIDEEKCNGCGLCIPNCHEGALQIIDGKARLISDLFCDGLGACLGHCPEGAIEIIEREAQPYNESVVMETIVKQGRNTILAHLEHLRDHNENELLKEAVAYIKKHQIDLSPGAEIKPSIASTVIFENMKEALNHVKPQQESACGCGSSKTIDFRIDMDKVNAAAAPAVVAATVPASSELRQWPVQLHLVNPMASYFQGADVVLAADCVAFAMGDFHERLLKNKSLAIACPKLDTNKDVYVEKLSTMISDAKINTLTVPIMEVPCCGGLMQMAKIAVQQSGRNIPIKKIVVGIKGDILQEEWV
ncbi:MAG TPA: 4Fe-4S binding protein [Bacteroidales bacterium]|nr:4Fe-4S binding protein [Bacteroidales bacterium]